MKDIDSNNFQSLRMGISKDVIQVSLPASAYFELDRFQAIQKDILGRLGCPACCSGWDIRYDLQRRFQVDEKFNVREF